MKKFKFKLEAILKLREIEEKNKLGELAKVVGQINKWNADIETFTTESTHKLKEESVKLRQHKSTFKDMQITREYFTFLNRKKKLALKKIEELQPALVQKQVEYNEARKEKKKYEILRKKKFKEYQYELEKEEQKFIDELAQRKIRN